MQHSLTELQLAIMDVLWDQGEATVVDVHDELRKERRIAQSTVATLLSRLEKRGMVVYRTEGRQHVYQATVSQEQVRRSVVDEFSELTRRLFSGDVAGLVSHLLSTRDVQPEELAHARRIIAEKEQTLRLRSGEA